MSLRPSERTELRRSSFKPSADLDERRRRRVGFTVDIRKRSRDSALQKTRRAAAGGEAAPLARSQQPSPVPETRLGSIPAQLAEGLLSGDISVQVEAVREFRKLLSIENPPTEEVVSSGLVPVFIQLLSREGCPELQFEVEQVLTTIALRTADDTIAMLIFVKLLSSPSEDVREQVVWALGKMASNTTICRGLILAHGALFPVLQQFCGHAKLSMLHKASWALLNICHGLSQADFEHVKPALPVLRQLIHSQDVEVLSNACRALSYLSDGGNDNIQAVIEAGACPQLVELLNHSSPSVLIPVLHVIGNIVSRDDAQIQCIIDLQALPYLLNLLTTNRNKGIKPEVCRIISNIMAGNKEQIQSVINGNMVGPLVHLMHTAEFGVRYEAAWAIANAASGGTHDQKRYLVSQGCIKAFCDLLSYSDTSILMVCLEGLDDILKAGEADKSPWGCNVNMYAQMIEDNEWLDKIENLQNHDNSRIVEMAACLLESYWSNEDKAMPMPWDDPVSWLAEDNTPNFSFFDGPGDCDFG
ncbi:hypothetical protein SETIT_5G160800v2 [Setaria italica]|uniref:Importin subunit alpha n=2 Tax=Setaria italica TaxID=4555 RepID=K3XGG9_SETIT|nr:importin subunit alpha-1b [Setaria italica]RCV25366.1 hypothetical protein SETIT_5G160800v2 [Setaria italica]